MKRGKGTDTLDPPNSPPHPPGRFPAPGPGETPQPIRALPAQTQGLREQREHHAHWVSVRVTLHQLT